MPTEIPIRTSETQPFIVVPTEFNDKGPFPLLLDTGAAMSIMTEELAGLIGISGTEVKEGVGSAGKPVKVVLGHVRSVSIGEARVENVRVGILKDLPRCIGHGVVGYNVLKEFGVTIDYGGQRLTLTSPGPGQGRDRTAQGYLPLRLARPERPILLVEVLVNSRDAFQFVLDTGAGQTVVSPELAHRMGMEDLSIASVVGAGGPTPGSLSVAQSLSVGRASLNGVAVIVADIFSGLSQATGARLDGVLGFNFLRHFTVDIDYPHENLRFTEQMHAG
jgi:predicted aspartyl protease